MNIKSDAPSLDVLKRIKALVFDIDGVLSDGTVYLPNVGSYVRRINVKDAYALQLAVKCGYHVAV
ncbi:MAG: hypothetical protein MRY83_16110, partial [Flavobacteriales bacterium]|nr:hypothetical protein [Flavobacteriales bacterium]